MCLHRRRRHGLPSSLFAEQFNYWELLYKCWESVKVSHLGVGVGVEIGGCGDEQDYLEK
jgi:hypothetical protein